MLTFDVLPQQVQNLTIEVKNLQNLIENLKITLPKIEERLSIAGLANYLEVSEQTIHNYKKRGVLPFHQTGRTVYFLKHEVDEALASNKKKKC